MSMCTLISCSYITLLLFFKLKNFNVFFYHNVIAALEKAYCEDMDNIILVHRSPRLELEATANAMRKTMKAYR